MSETYDIALKPQKVVAIEMFALNPGITCREVAEKCKVSESLVGSWRQDPFLMDKIYERYMVEFGAELPAVISAMVREAKAGNVQAARLVLEHSGKLVKNVNITIDSPFEKFLKTEDIQDAEIVEAFDHVMLNEENLPPRKESTPIKEEKYRLKSEVEKDLKQRERNEKRREWYKWKVRAKNVGVKHLGAKRPTKGQREAWRNKIRKKENESN